MMSEELRGLLRIPSETGCSEEYDEEYGKIRRRNIWRAAGGWIENG